MSDIKDVALFHTMYVVKGGSCHIFYKREEVNHDASIIAYLHVSEGKGRWLCTLGSKGTRQC